MLVLPPLPTEDRTASLLGAGAVALLLVVLTHRWLNRSKLQGRDKHGNAVPLRKLPMPKSTLPFLGNILDFANNSEWMLDWSSERSLEFKNEPWKRKIPGQPEIITISSPDAIEEITITQFENFEKGALQRDVLGDTIGRGLVASDGERWYHQRKMAAKFFSARSLRAFMNKSMHKNMVQLCGIMDKAIQDETSVELKTLFHEFTLQTFVEMGFGVDLQWIGAEHVHPFVHAIETAAPIIGYRFRRPVWFWRLQRWLRVGVEGTLARSMDTIFSWMHGVLKQSLGEITRKQALESEQNPKPDGASEEIKSVVQLFAENSREDVEGIRSEDMVDFLLTFVVAARDTTALTLSWLFYELGKHPHVEQALREEMRLLLPEEVASNKHAYLTTEHTRSLVYLEATLKEVLRLRPAAPTTVKQVIRDTVICGDVPLYKGQLVLLHAYAMARNPRAWGDDAAEFKPERWIDPVTKQLIHVPASKFFTFSAGPRTCIGMNLAMLELRVVTANLLHRFRFDVDPANDGSYITTITHMMKHPLYARVHTA